MQTIKIGIAILAIALTIGVAFAANNAPLRLDCYSAPTVLFPDVDSSTCLGFPATCCYTGLGGTGIKLLKFP